MRRCCSAMPSGSCGVATGAGAGCVAAGGGSRLPRFGACASALTATSATAVEASRQTPQHAYATSQPVSPSLPAHANRWRLRGLSCTCSRRCGARTRSERAAAAPVGGTAAANPAQYLGYFAAAQVRLKGSGAGLEPVFLHLPVERRAADLRGAWRPPSCVRGSARAPGGSCRPRSRRAGESRRPRSRPGCRARCRRRRRGSPWSAE